MRTGVNDPCPCGSGEKYKHCCLNIKANIYKPIVLLFGAGASLECSQMDENPPRGSELFNSLQNEFDKSWKLVDGEYFKKPFEEGMLALYENPGPNNVNELLVDMGIFFSRFKINHPDDNLYCKLFKRYKNQILSGQIVLATLNYECLIEYALNSLGINWNYFDENNGAKLFKLHGSCNFCPQGIKVGQNNINGNPSMGGLNIYGKLTIATVNLDFPMEIVQPYEAEKQLSAGGILPAMSLYARGKKNIICKKQILEMQRIFQTHVNNTHTIITIGVQPNENDDHIWSHIKKSKADTFLIGSKTYEEWHTKYNNGKAYVNWKHFKDAEKEIYDIIDRRL